MSLQNGNRIWKSDAPKPTKSFRGQYFKIRGLKVLLNSKFTEVFHAELTPLKLPLNSMKEHVERDIIGLDGDVASVGFRF